jgi:hypothetical protein
VCNAPSEQRCLRGVLCFVGFFFVFSLGGGHVSLLGDAMTEGEWERVRRGEQACATQGEGKVPPRDPGALEEVEWRGMFSCGTTLMWLSASYRTSAWELSSRRSASFSVAGAGFPCAMRGEDSGLRCLEIERARRKHGSLVDGQEQRCALLDDERWGADSRGSGGTRRSTKSSRKAGRGVTIGMRRWRGGCNRIAIFNTVGLWRGH